MADLKRTDAGNQDFQSLVVLLDEELRQRDGDEHVFYAQFNSLDRIRHAVVAYQDDIPVGCGALRPFDDQTAEIKRMFVHPLFRGQGIAQKILAELEKWAWENLIRKCILETGFNQPEAIALYQKSGYQRIANYGPYGGIANSLCMEKVLTSTN